MEMAIWSASGISVLATRKSNVSDKISMPTREAPATYIIPPRVGSRRRPASSSAPIAPTAAASVGVAMPARIEPSTATISTSGGTRACMRRGHRAPPAAAAINSSRGIAGEEEGLSQAMASW